MIAVADVLRRDALLSGAYGDGHAVLVAAADEDNVLFLQTQIAYINVGRNIYTGQMADVNTAVGIGQGGGDSCAFKLFLFHIFVLSD